MNAAKVIVSLVVVAVLAGGTYAVTRNKNSNSAPTASHASTASTSNSGSGSSTPASQVAATITFSDTGFSPSITTVKVGDTVQITNSSSQIMQFDSDPHPVHSDETELNVGTVEPGQSAAFKVTRAGHWGFHDHLNPSLTGTLIVEQ